MAALVRSYIRFDPQRVEKMLSTGYSPSLIAAWMMLQSQAEQQVQRGRFKSLGILKAAMDCAEETGGPKARMSQLIPALLDRGDLVRLDDGTYYADGWDELQEGDQDPKQRMVLVRGRKARPGDSESPGAIRNRRYRAKKGDPEEVPCDGVTASHGDAHVTSHGDAPEETRDASHEAGLVPSQSRVTRGVSISRKQKAEGIDTDSRHQDAASAGMHAVEKPTGPTLGPEGTALVQGYQQLGYVQPSAVDRIKAEEFVVELDAMTVPDILARMADHLVYCDRHHLPKPRTLAGFWPTLRRENEFRRDNGTKPRRSTARVPSQGLTDIGAMLRAAVAGGAVQ